MLSRNCGIAILKKKGGYKYIVIDAVPGVENAESIVVDESFFPVSRPYASDYTYVLTREFDDEPTWFLSMSDWRDGIIRFVARRRVNPGEVQLEEPWA